MVAVLKFPTALRSAASPVTRVITEADAEWMRDLARRRYSKHYDFEAAEMWMRNVVVKQPMVFYPIRTDNAFMVSLISMLPWTPGETEASVILLCAEKNCVWDIVKLARASRDWAIRRHCWRWGFNSDVDIDLGPLAHWLGLIVHHPRYSMALK